MQINTLLATLAYSVDEVELYTRNWELISRMTPYTLQSEYGHCRVSQFWVYADDDATTLEIILR